jgi:hypothetical protein
MAGKAYYNYYNLTDAQLRKDHHWKASASYPAATADYGQALKALGAKPSSKAEFYRKLYSTLGFSFLEDAYTVTSVSDLTDRIRRAADSRENELVVRYTRGGTVKSDLKKALNAQTGVAGMSYTMEDYTRTTINDKLLRIKLQY